MNQIYLCFLFISTTISMITVSLKFGWERQQHIMIPTPTLVKKTVPPSKVILAIHFLNGPGVTSKIGTKASALKAKSEKYLQKFGRLLPLSVHSFELAEEYLVKVLKPNTSCKTFNKLRGEILTQVSTRNLFNLSCTSSSLQGHLNRSFYMVYMSDSALNKDSFTSTNKFWMGYQCWWFIVIAWSLHSWTPRRYNHYMFLQNNVAQNGASAIRTMSHAYHSVNIKRLVITHSLFQRNSFFFTTRMRQVVKIKYFLFRSE